MPIPPKPLPDLDVLRAMFRYDPDTGAIYNLVSRTNRRAGARAESIDAAGYLVVSIKGRLLKAHRVAWFLHYGTQATKFIDHIDGVKQNNRIANLRVVDHQLNMRNRRLSANNTSGFKGVSRRAPNCWRAYISVNRRRIYLGDHPSAKQAASAARLARAKLHGHFARD